MRKAFEERAVLKDLAQWMAEDVDAAVIVAVVSLDADDGQAEVRAAGIDTDPEHLLFLAETLVERARDRFLAMLDQDRARALEGIVYAQAILYAHDPEKDLAA